MNILARPEADVTATRPGVVLRGVDWNAYCKVVDAFNEVHARTTYFRGTLEIMSPLPAHEVLKHWFNQFFLGLTFAIGVRNRGLGSTTFRDQARAAGLEPDECYYFGDLSRLRNVRATDADTVPRPDLAIEVDVTTSVLPRLPVFAALGIPEVWRVRDTGIQVFRLSGGAHQSVVASVLLPFLPMDEILPLFGQTEGIEDDGDRFNALVAWFQARVRPLYDAWRQQQPSTAP